MSERKFTPPEAIRNRERSRVNLDQLLFEPF